MTKDDVVRIIINCAKMYDKNLNEHNLLFIVTDKTGNLSTYEMIFLPNNFMHMCGVKFREGKKLDAFTFYNRCLNHRLSPDDFELAEDGTTEMKLRVLPSLLTTNLSANMLGDYIGNKPMLFTDKLAGGSRGCIGFVNRIKNFYVPNTVLNVDIRDVIKDKKRIIITYRKHKNERKYQEIVYKAKNIDWNNFKYPDEIENLIIRE